ncbi:MULTISPECIES: histidine phosphatase family protein [Aquincola]|uniref:histidine phosphatase family protein n=1 Tax=Aquincola TaxID=391952 RepID=UPI000614B6DE|nr:MULTISPECIES: histidine phosphatase family protein [Aquincola]MCR5864190.1 histidine phosphatase family protein [Aquincola sp. J276]
MPASPLDPQQKWPDRLWVVRHGQSAGNVARDKAEAAGLPLIDIATRDMDVPLSALGERQSLALGEWFGGMPADERPNVVLCSPYVRARQTTELVMQAAGLAGGDDELQVRVDERLREKEFGILDRLTRLGIEQQHPQLAEQRSHVGKFYFRPPGGESWCDVILRLRSVLETVTREHRGERVLIVAHQVIVNCLRYLLERMDEAQVLETDRAGDVPNCAVTWYAFDRTLGRRGKLALQQANFVRPVVEAGEPVTAEPDMPAAPKS